MGQNIVKYNMDIESVEDNSERAAGLLKALSNEKRLTIMCALSKGEKSVGELESIIGLSQSALSQHLARLRRDGLVKTRREAQTIFYSADNPATNEILKCLHAIYSKTKVESGLMSVISSLVVF